MMRTRFTLPALLAFALAACRQPADDTNITIDNEVNAAEAANAEIETLPPNDSSAAAQDTPAATPMTEAAAPAKLPTQIPAQLHGRWGLVRADCTSTRGDAKGLIDVSDTRIKFYETLATLKEQRPAIATSFSGLFGFTGEGQTWEKVVTLTRTGDTLKRADKDGNFTYTRC